MKTENITLEEIIELMRLREWSQAELARQLGLTEGAISRWLSGENTPVPPTRMLLRQWLAAARLEKLAHA